MSELRTCKRPGCGLTFVLDPAERLRRPREYCKKSCRNKASYQRRGRTFEPQPRVCDCGCKQVFTPRHPDQKFISRKHWDRANPRSHKPRAPKAPQRDPSAPSRSAQAAARAAVERCPDCGTALGAEGPLLWCRSRERCGWSELLGQREPSLDAPDPTPDPEDDE